ncbi:LysR family transcriptional regulator [Roseomonas sp. CCTCC AB2023176]|uniref:LysR family transcriptional regulator n=1 Tax=Roseomonas sp. CCTCC AB2023176 TaxID=3342640 RepID=UPI0035D53008
MRQVNLRALDLNLLVPLDLLLDHRSVTAAARAANMSQPAMSRALGRLRATLRDPLLARGRDGLVPTPAAQALHPALKRILSEVQDLVSRRPFTPAEWRGAVRIAATDHQTTLLLPHLMRRIAQDAPGLDVTVLPFVAPMLDELRDGRLHLTFGIEENAVPPGLRQEPLYRDTFVTLLRAGHPALADWTVERFAALPHVLVTVLGVGRGAYDEELARRGLSRRVALRLPHFAAAMEVVARTDLVVTLPRTIALRHAASLGLATAEPPIRRPAFTTTTIWPDVLDADPGITWLRGIIREEAAAIEGVVPLRPATPRCPGSTAQPAHASRTRPSRAP